MMGGRRGGWAPMAARPVEALHILETDGLLFPV